jgi:hypothetical protein
LVIVIPSTAPRIAVNFPSLAYGSAVMNSIEPTSGAAEHAPW